MKKKRDDESDDVEFMVDTVSDPNLSLQHGDICGQLSARSVYEVRYRQLWIFVTM